PELYDQASDPKAQRNLVLDSKAVADTLQSQLTSFHDKTSTAKTEQAKLDPVQAENLRALGYLASDSVTTTGEEKDAIDPKDKIQIANLFHQAMVDIEEDRYDDAIPKFQQVIEGEPSTSSAYLELGRAFIRQKDYQSALLPLETAVAKMSDSGMAHYELGLALVKTGQWEAALPEMQAAAVKTPESAQMHFYVGAVFARLKRIPEAIKDFQTTLRLDPNHYLGNLIYGRLLFLEGHPEQALPKLQRAAKIEPDLREPHRFLA